jgi:hypothetical protein
MLTFLTLLLGIIHGPHPVALNAPARAASVELVLDGELFAIRRAPPWEFVVDFGEFPAPHDLDAIARDGRGGEIGRARQRINVPRPAAEAVLALLPGRGGAGRTARLTWESSVGARPDRVTVTFDGESLAAPDLERIDLPTFVPERLHFLRAILDFRSGVSATAEIAFGGRHHDETEKELTAFPVRAPGGKLPPPEAMDGWFFADGESMHVAAVEEGKATVVFVSDADGPPAFRRMKGLLPGGTGFFKGTPSVQTLLAYGHFVAGKEMLFKVFDAVGRDPGSGLLAVLSRAAEVTDGNCPTLADAVAVAGVFVSRDSRPRAVVLILTGNPDASLLSASAARSYLADLGVPLVVWLTGPAAPDAALEWGGGVEVKTRAARRAAVKSLDSVLSDQRIVWVEGAHLPQSITVSPMAAPGVTIAR